MERTFTAIVHQDDDGSFWAQVEELPGCFATGDDLHELQEALVEAITMYLTESEQAPERPSRAPEPEHRWKVEGNLTLTPA
jgi:predicted RNase H-like HicB family nuclease